MKNSFHYIHTIRSALFITLALLCILSFQYLQFPSLLRFIKELGQGCHEFLNQPSGNWKASNCIVTVSWKKKSTFAYQVISDSQISCLCIRSKNLAVDSAFVPLSSYILPRQMEMPFKTVTHAFCSAHALSMHTAASDRKFCFLHAYILTACSLLGAGKSNIYHFVSRLCLRSICSAFGDAREQLLAPIQYQPHRHTFIYLHLTAWWSQTAFQTHSLCPSDLHAWKKKIKQTINTWLLFPNIHIYFGWFHLLQQHNPARLMVHPNSSKCSVGLLLASIWHKAGLE